MKTQTKTPHTKITHNNQTMVKTKTTQPTTITMLAVKIMEPEATVRETMEVIKDLDTGLEITNALQSVNTSAFQQKQKDHTIKKRSKKKQIISYTSFERKK
ncbi:Hypothetical_protein [Hexamita inflata]|uniref:Hypothetical_protein n=1 Tax=Hexamita inflata TaxID=28002 RepID=A0AA86QE38_9EUKA|nr:Hypothetical protein HINF_LOCUS45156 [Hexamita inflata]